jgi:prolyl 4-hydroxylase
MQVLRLFHICSKITPIRHQTMGFVEEKKENDSVNGANCVKTSDCQEDDVKKPDDEKINMLDSFDMEENDGRSEQHEHVGQWQNDVQENAHVVNLTGPPTEQQQYHLQPQTLTNMNHVTNNEINAQAAQTAQQSLAQTSISQQHQQLQQLAQQPSISLDALPILPQHTLGYLAQSPSNSISGTLNLLAVQNALVQNHQQAMAQAHATALMGAGGTNMVQSPAPPLVGNIVSNGFSFGQQFQNQHQPAQYQQAHLVGSSGSSISSTNPLFPAAFPNAQQAVPALSPANQIASSTTAMQQPLYSTGQFPTPSIFGPALPSASLTLTPQLTIPHYVPPTPASWGAPLPILTVQDRPLVSPIYNGINPNYPKAQMLHAHPPIFCVHEFLTPAECDFLIEAASDAFGPAPVVGKGQGEVSPSRTSSTCYLAREDLPEYMRKVSLLTGKPAEHCELPQVGRYLPSQQYLQHFDAFDLSNEDGRRFAQNGGQRTITVLTYLNDVGLGGATAFPNLNIQVQPRRGMALVFFPSTLDGLLDKMALHAALPAVDIKYVSQVWIRQSNYDGRPSKRLVQPMIAGLQEQRDNHMLMSQFLQQVSVNQQQQQQQQQQGS